MKTIEQINKARQSLREKCLTPGLSQQQTVLLSGMLNALVWVADGPDSTTMDRLLAGEPIAAGQSIAGSFVCRQCGGERNYSLSRGLFCPKCEPSTSRQPPQSPPLRCRRCGHDVKDHNRSEASTHECLVEDCCCGAFHSGMAH